MENQSDQKTTMSVPVSSGPSQPSFLKKIVDNIVHQIIPIMIGVYLGFALNNFGESRKLAKQKTVFTKMLFNEVKDNRREVAEKDVYHLKLKQDFIEIRESEDVKAAMKAYRMTGLRPGLVSSSAYDTGIQTGIIQEFDLTLIQLLNRLYNYQNKYNSYNENMVNSLFSNGFPETEKEIKDMLTMTIMSLNDVESFERELQDFYQGVLNELAKK